MNSFIHALFGQQSAKPYIKYEQCSGKAICADIIQSIIPFDVLRYNHELLLKGIKELPVEKTAKLIEEHYMIVPEVLHEKQCKKSE